MEIKEVRQEKRVSQSPALLFQRVGFALCVSCISRLKYVQCVYFQCVISGLSIQQP